MVLKDWKRTSKTKFVNKKRKGTLYIGDRSVSIEIDMIKLDGRINFPQTHIYEEFDSKAEALAFANDYMKTH